MSVLPKLCRYYVQVKRKGIGYWHYRKGIIEDCKRLQKRFIALTSIWNSSLHKKWSFPLRISSVNVIKSAVSSGFGHINWRNS